MSKRPLCMADAPDEVPDTSKRPRISLNTGLTLPISAPKRYANEDYTICWICALVTEYVAAQALLDETHGQPTVSRHDDGDYVLGNFGQHNVVLAVMPGGEYGKSSATATAKDLRNTFPNIRFGLMVGIGGGAPSPVYDIRLGDVVVSLPEDERGGVFQYDFGKTIQNQAFRTTGYMDQPPRLLRSALNGLRSHYEFYGHNIKNTIEDAFTRIPRLKAKYKRPDPTSDRLYQSDFLYPAYNVAHCTDVCGADGRTLIIRLERRQDEDNPAIHYGMIASADTLMKDAKIRDRLAAEKNVLCFEMEAAGLMNILPCLVIRGICDYSDTHKNKDWQGYAAMTAAAYAKDLLRRISPRDVESLVKTRCDAPEELEATILESTIDEETMRLFLSSLRFSTINNRQKSIKDAHAKTCEWLLDTDQYLDWLDSNKLEEHLGFLWIKGKPGAGKSTLMNYVFIKALEKRADNTAVVSFFFNARGDNLEKTMIGMYRSLLLQLLEKHPKLQSIIHVPEPVAPDDYTWTIELLQSLFKQAILSLSQSSVICFIDALDECDEDQVRDMMAFLEQLSLTAVLSGITFRVCFASRYYPNISIAKGLTLELERQAGHSNDITAYIDSELKIDKGPVADEIRSELREKASGVFMWVFLVIGILNTTCDRGRYHELQQKLREIPGTLHELFRDMLTRDEYNKDELLLCIQWVLFARQPLKPRELYFAILSGTTPDVITKWKSGAIPTVTIEKFLTDASKGLVELTVSSTPTVQFIHESVRDFLIRDNGLSEICYSAGQDFVARSYEQLKKCCLHYINADAVASLVDNKSTIKGSFRQAWKIREFRNEGFPFLQYALENILYHANLAGEDLEQTTFLQSFPRTKWMRLVNIYRQSWVRYQNASLLYILAEQYCGKLIRYHSNNLSCFEIEDERYLTPMFASLGAKSHNATRSLLQAIAESQPLSSPKHDICEQYDKVGIDTSNPDLESLFLRRQVPKHTCTLPFELNNEIIMHAFLIAYNYSNINVKHKNDNLLFWAVEGGHDQLCEAIFEKLAKTWTIDACQQTLLHRATHVGQEKMVRVLLEKGTDIEALDACGQTSLELALRRKKGAVIQILLDEGANTSVLCADNHRNLFDAIECGQRAIVKLLLENGVDNKSFGFYHCILQTYAIEHGQEAIVKLLLDNAADTKASSLMQETLLLYAVRRGREAIVKLLLENGANIHALDFDRYTATFDAIARGQVDIVRLLLENGVGFEAFGFYHYALLTYAIVDGQEAIVKLLLETGADIQALNLMQETSLFYAIRCGQEAIVKLLLENGADIEALDFDRYTPLFCAIECGRVAIVKLLLENGADIKALDGHGRTPLLYSTTRNDIKSSRLLITHGADLSCTDSAGYTPLHRAAYSGNVGLVELFLENGANPSAVSTAKDQEQVTPLKLASHDRVQDQLHCALFIAKLANRGRIIPFEPSQRIVIDLTTNMRPISPLEPSPQTMIDLTDAD
ncbi:hypothetical protein QQS21_011661 [Conoideocrella luteorostrata]|uniref:NACHT domain-containing protein n=1 Tax=Conoideocrella luteorostrata TaxID=1105319 RepID=A0AAJ0CHA4_9HYPO|nr:hypothetical protein QQS21_011661 [Conoideocrella luteorostrata]